MPYNLLREPWLPVRRQSGAITWIAPHQISERNDPPVALACPRPDFDGALIQFLIGLMQTTAAPGGKRDWLNHFESPHQPSELESLFRTVEAAFNLDGDGPRFFQDLTLKDEPNQTWAISDLVIGTPGENTIKNNADLFEKRGRVTAVSLETAAMALLALQLNSPEGGGGAAGGHNVSIRGGGPLTTIASGATLFQTVWLNTIEREAFDSKFGNRALTDPQGIFPWMGKTRSSAKSSGGVLTTPQDVHPLQQFWAMPRRIRLVIDPDQIGLCDLTGRTGVGIVSQCLTSHSGFKYSVGFRHPLSPYRRQEGTEEWRAIRGHPSAVAYTSWPTNVFPGTNSEPARAVSAALARAPELHQQISLVVFGFETKQEKVKAWHHAVTPLFGMAAEYHEAFRAVVQGFVGASESVRLTLLQKVGEALAPRKQTLPGDLGATVNSGFWSRTEAAFFDSAIAVRDALPAGNPSAEIAERWLAALHDAAKDLFEAYSQMNGEFSATDVHRVAIAWHDLRRYTSPQARPLRTMVGLHTPDAEKPAAKRGKRPKREVTP